jgi:6-phosphogluconolactonase
MADDRMSAGAAPQSRIFDTPEELARQVADWIVERARSLEGRGIFAVCLSGGSTPKRLYELLAQAPRRASFPWDRTHWFWGDERVVPHDDPRSNFHMAWEALLRHAPVPADNIHAISTERVSPAAGAADYEAALKRFYGADMLDAQRPLFDLTLLGLGEDGHIASLFPGSPSLAEMNRWVVPVVGESPVDRITLTYPPLASSSVTAFVVVGERKRKVLARVRAGDPASPAARLQPVGAVYCFADRAAVATPAFTGR